MLTATTLGKQDVMTNRAWSDAQANANADAQRGEMLSAQCRACHSLQRDGDDIIGPKLFGFFGNPAGRSSTFDYSAGLASGDFIWTPRALDAWLANPGRFFPANNMAYAGLLYAEDRNALIAYLLQATDDDDTSSSSE
jgi:cytochrome c